MKPYVKILTSVDIEFQKSLRELRSDPLFSRNDNLYTKHDKERIAKIWKDMVRPFLTLKRIIRVLYWRSFLTFGSKNSFVVNHATIITYYNMLYELRGSFGSHEEFLRQYLDDTFRENYSTLARYMYHIRFYGVLIFPHEFFLSLKDQVDPSLIPLFDRRAKIHGTIERGSSLGFINIWYYIRYRISLLLSWFARHGGMILSHIYFSKRDIGLITNENITKASSLMYPGDICITRRNWAATNMSIPGFWKHMSMYIGTGEFLKANFNNSFPVVSTFLDHEHYIIESVGTGIQIVPLTRLALHNDYLGVLRTRFSEEKKLRSIHKAISQLSASYDFTFNYYSDINHVCSALVTKSYLKESENDEGITIELVRIGTGITYPPNNIIKKFVKEKNTPFQELDFVCFIDSSERNSINYLASEKDFLLTAKRSRLSPFLP